MERLPPSAQFCGSVQKHFTRHCNPRWRQGPCAKRLLTTLQSRMVPGAVCRGCLPSRCHLEPCAAGIGLIKKSAQFRNTCSITASPVAQRVKRLPAMQETRVRSLGWEVPLAKEMATHSSILAWRIPWMEEPGELQCMGSQRVGHD